MGPTDTAAGFLFPLQRIVAALGDHETEAALRHDQSNFAKLANIRERFVDHANLGLPQ
jgi:hypothetical protein